ncbi:MAG: hypothetical protein II831_01065 [Firmicutes bacterium]|nr:hypothetical protein [Bacillota bacterium]
MSLLQAFPGVCSMLLAHFHRRKASCVIKDAFYAATRSFYILCVIFLTHKLKNETYVPPDRAVRAKAKICFAQKAFEKQRQISTFNQKALEFFRILWLFAYFQKMSLENKGFLLFPGQCL